MQDILFINIIRYTWLFQGFLVNFEELYVTLCECVGKNLNTTNPHSHILYDEISHHSESLHHCKYQALRPIFPHMADPSKTSVSCW